MLGDYILGEKEKNWGRNKFENLSQAQAYPFFCLIQVDLLKLLELLNDTLSGPGLPVGKSGNKLGLK